MRLIDADALGVGRCSRAVLPVDYCAGWNGLVSLIEQAPTIDAVEVVHGYNVKDYDSAFQCSVCGWEDWDTMTCDTEKHNFCPNCGAKMDGERREQWADM